jgi:hypothetical protein
VSSFVVPTHVFGIGPASGGAEPESVAIGFEPASGIALEVPESPPWAASAAASAGALVTGPASFVDGGVFPASGLTAASCDFGPASLCV